MNRRVFLNDAVHPGQVIALAGGTGHHLARVLRLRIGENLVVAAANGPHAATVQAVDDKRGEVTLSLGETVSPRDPTVRIHLVQAFVKADKVDDIVEKCTEVGVAGVCVTPTRRSVGRLEGERLAQRIERWRRIAAEAAGQAQRDVVPEVVWCPSNAAVAEHIVHLQVDALVLLDEQEQSVGIRRVLQEARTRRPSLQTIVLAIGPEGGWEDTERDWFRQLGAVSVTLGGRILRTETAGLVAASAILYETGELGG